MSLRNRTILTIILATLVIVVLGAVHGYFVFLRNYEELEILGIKESVIHILTSLEYKLDDLSAITNDWAAWDDSYQFVQDNNEDYIDSNLVDGTFESLGLDLIIYFDTEGQIVFEKAYDLEEGEEIPVNEEIHDYFNNNSDLFSIVNEDQISGFIPYGNNLMLYSLNPILTSMDEGPSTGFLLFAYQANEFFLEKLKTSRFSEISILPYNTHAIPEESANLKLFETDLIDVYTNEISGELIEYYIIIEDIVDNPIFVIKQVEERTIYQQGLENMRNQITVIILTCFSAGGTLILMLDKYLLSRISTLHQSVISYRNKKKDRKPVCLPGNDELSQLSFEIDSTLHSLLITQTKLNGYLEYGNLMVDISTKFINLPISKINQSLQNVLETVCKYIDVDRGQILIFNEDDNSLEEVYEWQKGSTKKINRDFLKLDRNLLSWAFKLLNTGKMIVLSRNNDLPKTATFEKIILKKFGIQSVIGVPLMVAGKLIGLISIQMVNQPRIWDEKTPILMEIISNIIANAIDRKRNEIQLQNSKQFQYQLNQITKTGIEKDSYDSSIRALSRQLRSLINSDHCWLILPDRKQGFQVFESGKKHEFDNELSKIIDFLVNKTSNGYYIHNSSKSTSKKEFGNLNIIGNSFIALPLSAKNQYMGLILLVNDTDHRFTALEKGICQQAAKQITLAMIKIRALEESQALSRELQDLREAVMEFSSVLDIDKLHNSILTRAVKLLQAEGGEFYTYEEDTNELITVHSHNMNNDYSGTRLKIGEGAAGKAVEQRKLFSIIDYSKWSNRVQAYDDAKIRASLSMPLMVGEKILGCISVFQYDENKQFSRNNENMLSIFAQHASIAMDNAMLFNKIQEMAHIDELTGLLNRRALNEIGDYEIRRAGRLNRPIAVVMVDLDNFKKVNDTYNHIIGDKVLKDVGRVFRENLRNIDILGRYGGDESIIIMPETNLENAVQTIKRVQEKLRASNFKVNKHKLKINASYGISAYSENPPSLETMIEEADAAMYAAKDAGRNCIRVYKNN